MDHTEKKHTTASTIVLHCQGNKTDIKEAKPHTHYQGAAEILHMLLHSKTWIWTKISAKVHTSEKERKRSRKKKQHDKDLFWKDTVYYLLWMHTWMVNLHRFHKQFIPNKAEQSCHPPPPPTHTQKWEVLHNTFDVQRLLFKLLLLKLLIIWQVAQKWPEKIQ